MLRIEKGLCPYEPLKDVPCACGATRWPVEYECKYPSCIYSGDSAKLNCD